MYLVCTALNDYVQHWPTCTLLYTKNVKMYKNKIYRYPSNFSFFSQKMQKMYQIEYIGPNMKGNLQRTAKRSLSSVFNNAFKEIYILTIIP